jgi:hypothetical protein
MVVGWAGLVFSLIDVLSDVVNSCNWIVGGAIIHWFQSQIGQLVSSGPGLKQDEVPEWEADYHVVWGSVGLFLVFLPGLSAAVGWILEEGELENGGGKFSFQKARQSLQEWDVSDWLWYLLCTLCYPVYLVTVCVGWADYPPYAAMSIEAYWEAAPQLWLNLHVLLSGHPGSLLQLFTTALSAAMIIKNSMVDQFNTFGVELTVSLSCLRFVLTVFFSFFTSIVFRLTMLAIITAYLKVYAIAFLCVHFCLLLCIGWYSQLRGPELVDVLHASAFMSSGNALDENGLRRQRKFLDRSNYYITITYTLFLITILVLMNLNLSMEHWSSLTLSTCHLSHLVCPGTSQWNANLLLPLLAAIGMINLLIYKKLGEQELGGEAMKKRKILEAQKMDAEGGEELLLEALLTRAVRRRVETRRIQGNSEEDPEENGNNVSSHFYLPSNRQEAQEKLDECTKQILLLEEKEKAKEMIEEKKLSLENEINVMDLRKQELIQEIKEKEEKKAQLTENLNDVTERLVTLEEKEMKIKENLKSKSMFCDNQR